MWSGGMKWYAGIGTPDVSIDILKHNRSRREKRQQFISAGSVHPDEHERIVQMISVTATENVPFALEKILKCFSKTLLSYSWEKTRTKSRHIFSMEKD